jgi:Domain of unknown function (DUF4387)
MTETRKTLRDFAAIIRSKNAGPYRLTFDVLFRDDASFQAVRDSGAITRETVARAYGVDPSRVSSLFVVPEGRAIKVTLIRPVGQGEAGDADMYGCQQHVPLMNLVVPIQGAGPCFGRV